MCRVAISTLFGKRKKDTDWVFRVIGGLDRVGAVCQFQQISLSFISFRQRLRIPLVNCALKSSHFFFFPNMFVTFIDCYYSNFR